MCIYNLLSCSCFYCPYILLLCFSFYCSVLCCCHVLSLLWPPSSSLKKGEGGEEEVVVEVLCLPASGCDLELYVAELLYRHRPIEAPVSPRKCTLKNRKAGGWRRFTSLAELQRQKITVWSINLWVYRISKVGFSASSNKSKVFNSCFKGPYQCLSMFDCSCLYCG